MTEMDKIKKTNLENSDIVLNQSMWIKNKNKQVLFFFGHFSNQSHLLKTHKTSILAENLLIKEMPEPPFPFKFTTYSLYN